MKPRESRAGSVTDAAIVAAALAWAKAERELRDKLNYMRFPTPRASGEEQHRISLTADWTEEQLLRLCETRLRNPAPTGKRRAKVAK